MGAADDDVWMGAFARVANPDELGGASGSGSAEVLLPRYCNVFIARCAGLGVDPEVVWSDAVTLPPEGSGCHLVQVTMADGRTRGHHTRKPAERQACHDVSVHVYVAPGRVPNVKATALGVLHVTGCVSLAEVRLLMQVLSATPGFTFAPGNRCYVDAILVNTKFTLGWEVDRVLLWREIERLAERGGGPWRATFNSEKKHVGVSVFCPSVGPTDRSSPIPCWTVTAGGQLEDVAGTVRDVLPLLRKEHKQRIRRRRSGPRHTFRVFRKQGKVVHVCSWPPELAPTHQAFLELMRSLRSKVELRLGEAALRSPDGQAD